MNTSTNSKTGLFLIELIISIFFFIVISAICIQLFVKSHTLSNDTINLNHSIMWLENVCEVFIANNGDFSKIPDCIQGVNSDKPGEIHLLFNENWDIIDNVENALFELIATNSITSCESGQISNMHVQVINLSKTSNQTIYETTLEKFTGGGVISGNQ